MKRRLRIGLAVACSFTAFAAWRAQPSAIARQFADDVEQGRYVAADALLAPSADVNLADWSVATQEMKAEVAFAEQTWGDWLRGRRAGQLNVGRTFKRFAVDNEMEIIASALGIQVTSHREARNDFPTLGESMADWARDAGVTIAELAKFALNGRQ